MSKCDNCKQYHKGCSGGEEMADYCERRNCPLRHEENGNCLSLGGFCTAVSDELCKAMRDAYVKGWRDAAMRIIRVLEQQKEMES